VSSRATAEFGELVVNLISIALPRRGRGKPRPYVQLEGAAGVPVALTVAP
jgi:hypothetical protein